MQGPGLEMAMGRGQERGQQEVSRLVGLLHTCEDTDKLGWD